MFTTTGKIASMTVAIYYHPEAYTTEGPKLMGRNAAGESFLRGFITHSSCQEFWVQVAEASHAERFSQTVKAFGRTEPVQYVDRSRIGALAQPGLVYYPGPGIGEHAFHRSLAGGVLRSAAWSLCGITHTTSSAKAMDALTAILTSPVQPWDAVICTSKAVKSNVTYLLQAQVDYLKDRLGITKLVLPQLPVIPLGIHTSDFVFTSEQRQSARSVLSVDSDTLVVLFMGRLSFHAKAHPLAMYQALEAASRQANKKVVLIECGWHANEFIAKAFREAAQLACPNVRVVTLDGRDASQRQTAWAGADIFCSLSDNIQETFGIAPIEAMAAGLPVIVSDWDGYKDTVRHEVDGFRIPTLMPQAGLGSDLALRHALEIDTYDMYCGHTCSLVAVDIEAAAQSFVKLFSSQELRRQMGEAAQIRTKEIFDWKTVIRQYEDLWASLAEIRKASAASPGKTGGHSWPARADPFELFGGYPTQTLTAQSLLALVDKDVGESFERVTKYRELSMVNFAKALIPAENEVENILKHLSEKPMTAAELVATIPEQRKAFVYRSLAWLLKIGILRVETEK
jgi:alpha-maltose-1-phosphate synthase